MEEETFEYPIDGILDLHQFQPREVASVLDEYLQECRRAGILRVRIIHGKGQGVLRQFVHSYLKKCGYVREFSTADDESSWGATIAIINPMNT
jgi:DNA-nicking Smr family endonuclease